MGEEKESLFYLGAGPLTAILLGIALVPLRGLTSASNLAFAFMALTIVVADFGGRAAAMGTALVSALSLDFFLTQPYLRLSIEDKHDLIAFIGLAACGLIAAALGSRRNRRVARVQTLEAHRDLLRSALRDWDAAAAPGPQLARLLRASREVFPIAAAVLRDTRGTVLASAGPADEERPLPEDSLQADTLLSETGSRREPLDWNLALPGRGGRIPLASGGRPLGALDVWGDGRPASAEARRALSDLARLIAAAPPCPRSRVAWSMSDTVGRSTRKMDPHAPSSLSADRRAAERGLVAELSLLEFRGLKLTSLRCAAAASFPVWLQAQSELLPSLAVWMALLAQAFCLARRVLMGAGYR